MPKKERKIEKLEDLKRKELIHIIDVYNRENIIKNYKSKNKVELIKLINKHILVSDNFKEIEPKPNRTKLITKSKYDKTISEEKEIKTEKDINALYKAFGGLKAEISKLKDKLKKLDEDYRTDEELGNDIYWVADYKDLKDDIKIQTDKLIKIRDKILKIENREVKKKEPKAKQDKYSKIIKNIDEYEKKMKHDDKELKKQFEEILDLDNKTKQNILIKEFLTKIENDEKRTEEENIKLNKDFIDIMNKMKEVPKKIKKIENKEDPDIYDYATTFLKDYKSIIDELKK